MHRKEKPNRLDEILATTAIISLIGSIFFLSNNITGNVIGSQGTSNIIGTIFLLIGLVESFFYFRNIRRKS